MACQYVEQRITSQLDQLTVRQWTRRADGLSMGSRSKAEATSVGWGWGHGINHLVLLRGQLVVERFAAESVGEAADWLVDRRPGDRH